MPLAVVSEDIRLTVEAEWREIPDDQAVIDYALKMQEELAYSNPAVGVFFANLLTNRSRVPWNLHVLRVVYACRVYRMLELAGAAVLVSPETAAPVQTEFLRDFNTYGQAIVDKLGVENPEVLNAGRALVDEFLEGREYRSASRVLVFGLLLYKIIESQKEANELAERLGNFGSET